MPSLLDLMRDPKLRPRSMTLDPGLVGQGQSPFASGVLSPQPFSTTSNPAFGPYFGPFQFYRPGMGTPPVVPGGPVTPQGPVSPVIPPRDSGGGPGRGREGGGPSGAGAAGGLSPGRSMALGILGAAMPGPMGLGIGALNAGLGLAAGAQQTDMMGKITGKPTSMSFADAVEAATGIGLGGYNAQGLGGYGNIGIGGLTGLSDMTDPGVMGPARALAQTRTREFVRDLMGGAAASRSGASASRGRSAAGGSSRDAAASRSGGALGGRSRGGAGGPSRSGGRAGKSSRGDRGE